MSRALSLSLCGIVALSAAAAPADKDKGKSDEAVQRARKTVRMLDDIYKQAIVLITDKYVKTKQDYPAGRAAIKWLNDIGKAGWPKTRLIDVTGEPSNGA